MDIKSGDFVKINEYSRSLLKECEKLWIPSYIAKEISGKEYEVKSIMDFLNVEHENVETYCIEAFDPEEGYVSAWAISAPMIESVRYAVSCPNSCKPMF